MDRIISMADLSPLLEEVICSGGQAELTATGRSMRPMLWDGKSKVRLAPAEFEGKRYLVNVSGTIQRASSSSKSKTQPELGNGFKDYTDDNGVVWVVDTNGVIQ